MNGCPIKSNTIQNICEQYDLTNLIKEPTCHKGPTLSLLDVILVSNARRYSATLNVYCDISDFHNIIGAATKRFAPSQKPRIILYRSYKNFSESEFVNSVASAPFHVMDIFDEIDYMAWYTSALLRNIIDEHAPMKTRIVKCDSLPYMNSAFRKSQYKRNMITNKFKRFGKQYWEENRRARNHVVKIRKQSIQKYFKDRCAKNDRNFWATLSPFFSDKRFRDRQNMTMWKPISVMFPNFLMIISHGLQLILGLTTALLIPVMPSTNIIPTQVTWKYDKYTIITKILSVLSW